MQGIAFRDGHRTNTPSCAYPDAARLLRRDPPVIAGLAFGSETLRQPSIRLSISVLRSSMRHVRLKRSREQVDNATVQRKI